MTAISFQDNSDEILSIFKKAVARGLGACGETAVTHAVENLEKNGSVDTGRLKGSIAYATSTHDGETTKYTKSDQEAGKNGSTQTVKINDENVCVIGSNVFYGVYVECGTGKYYPGGRDTPWGYEDEKGNVHWTAGNKAKPFLKPAITDHRKEYINLLKESLENA